MAKILRRYRNDPQSMVPRVKRYFGIAVFGDNVGTFLIDKKFIVINSELLSRGTTSQNEHGRLARVG